MRSALALLAFVSKRLTENARLRRSARLRRQSIPRSIFSLTVFGPDGELAASINWRTE